MKPRHKSRAFFVHKRYRHGVASEVDNENLLFRPHWRVRILCCAPIAHMGLKLGLGKVLTAALTFAIPRQGCYLSIHSQY